MLCEYCRYIFGDELLVFCVWEMEFDYVDVEFKVLVVKEW